MPTKATKTSSLRSTKLKASSLRSTKPKTKGGALRLAGKGLRLAGDRRPRGAGVKKKVKKQKK